jgi:hypothetical protein
LFQLRSTTTQGESTSEHQRYCAEEKVIGDWLQLSIACTVTQEFGIKHGKDFGLKWHAVGKKTVGYSN